jgi:ribosomal-protein-alanine N-acetyltransferase
MSIALRPLRPVDLEALVDTRMAEAGTMGNPAPARPREEIRSALRDRVRHSGTLFRGEILFGIQVDGELVGEIQARCPEHAMPPGVFELGIGVFAEADRGKGIGTRAVALMTARLFSEHGAHRVQAGTDLDNAAMRGVLERLGFGFEGVMRGFMPMPGKAPRDYALYALTATDYGDMKARWT